MSAVGAEPAAALTATEVAYRRRAISLLRRYDKTPHRRGDLTSFVRHLVDTSEELSSASWRQYRCSVRALLKRVVMSGQRDEAADARNALNILESACHSARRGRYTSAYKAKKFPAVDMARICAVAARRRARHAAALGNYLRAGVMTGLRLVEWRTAQIKESTPRSLVLVVQNGKFGNQRANGSHRELRFMNLAPADRACILQWLALAQAAERTGTFQNLIDGISSLLRRICDDLFPRRRRHYTLSSVRHEFAAMAKVGSAREEVAALMGHSVDTTATAHYGRPPRRALTPHEVRAIAVLPSPVPEQVATVRRKFDKKLARRMQYAAPGP